MLERWSKSRKQEPAEGPLALQANKGRSRVESATDRAGNIRPEPAAAVSSPVSPPLDQMSFTWTLLQTCYRWLFRRDGHSAGIQILMLPDGDLPDNTGTVIWSSRQRMDVLGHAITFG